ncbi:hypothetical protein Ataiwa_16410 [Algoriphagus taiwanensis]|uniref:Uncharacterized protein n=1 Tax=Algoriphagus taiwanensis TaxID=1445656 RepID=A0ABQ6PZL9_9BACT|nr:hypothetical protein Ataiwa_16410 [Algoriphagus taiwanensis]
MGKMRARRLITAKENGFWIGTGTNSPLAGGALHWFFYPGEQRNYKFPKMKREVKNPV